MVPDLSGYAAEYNLVKGQIYKNKTKVNKVQAALPKSSAKCNVCVT